MKTKYVILTTTTCFLLGFFVGRKTINQETKIEYIQLEPITGSVDKEELIPVKETITEAPDLPMKRDTIYLDSLIYIAQKVDTAAIIEDYIKLREYNLTLFDNKEIGKLNISPTVQYNKLIGLDYSFTPIQQRITIYKKKTWTPFLSGGYSTLDYLNIGGGVFYHNIGFEYQYQKSILDNNNGHLFNLKYKF